MNYVVLEFDSDYGFHVEIARAWDLFDAAKLAEFHNKSHNSETCVMERQTGEIVALFGAEEPEEIYVANFAFELVECDF